MAYIGNVFIPTILSILATFRSEFISLQAIHTTTTAPKAATNQITKLSINEKYQPIINSNMPTA